MWKDVRATYEVEETGNETYENHFFLFRKLTPRPTLIFCVRLTISMLIHIRKFEQNYIVDFFLIYKMSFSI